MTRVNLGRGEEGGRSSGGQVVGQESPASLFKDKNSWTKSKSPGACVVAINEYNEITRFPNIIVAIER